MTRLGTASSAADFGLVLGGVWEAKTIDFHTFFEVFSMQILDCKLEGQKIEKNSGKTRAVIVFGADAAVCAALGGRIIGWGESKFGLNFKPGLKIGL